MVVSSRFVGAFLFALCLLVPASANAFDHVAGEPSTAVIKPLSDRLVAARDSAKGLEPVKMAYFDFPPYIYADHGKISGSIAALAHEMMVEAGLEYEFISMPVARIYKDIAMGRVHFWIGTPGAAEMVGTTLMGTSVVGTSRLNIYGLGDSLPPRFEDLRDTAIITLKGYAYGGRGVELAARPGIRILATHNHASAFLMLQAGRAPYLLDYHTPSEQTMLELGMSGLHSTNVYERPNHLIVSKKSPHPELLLELLEAGVRRAYARRRIEADTAGD